MVPQQTRLGLFVVCACTRMVRRMCACRNGRWQRPVRAGDYMKLGGADRPLTLKRWLSSTPRRTFAVFPLLVLLFELTTQKKVAVYWPGLPLLVWGYLQYRWSGAYRTRHGGGGPGLDTPPSRLVVSGIYNFIRNPMYAGHLIFMVGLVIAFASPLAFGLLGFHCWWFHQRALGDEMHMRELFGADYDAYARRVYRWGLI